MTKYIMQFGEDSSRNVLKKNIPYTEDQIRAKMEKCRAIGDIENLEKCGQALEQFARVLSYDK